MTQQEVEVWDVVAGTPPRAGATIFWQRYECAEMPDAVSIPRLVEANAERLRDRYLAWVARVAESPAGTGVIDCFRLRPQVTLWWASLIAEKCNFDKSPGIEDAIRLMAFDDWGSSHPVSRLRLHSANLALVSCLRAWCVSRAIAFEFIPAPAARSTSAWKRRLLAALPPVCQALSWLVVYLVRRWPLRGAGLAAWRASGADVTIVSYLWLSTVREQGRARFASQFWGELPSAIEQDGIGVNWLHIYVPDPSLPTAQSASQAVSDFNESGRGRQNHAALDSFLSAGLVARSLFEWARLSLRARRFTRGFLPPASEGLAIWPLFVNDFRQSSAGIAGISGVLFLNLLEGAMAGLPHQRLGLYLQENQGWEHCLLQLWRAAGHGRIVGYPHSTVRFWDLRYYWDRREFAKPPAQAPPVPDLLAVNGPVAERELLDGGYPAGSLAPVEALRYLHLNGLKRAERRRSNPDAAAIRLLVLGDFSPSLTRMLMELLQQTAPLITTECRITIKPHPASPVTQAEYPALQFTLTDGPVAALLAECDLAVTGAITSAAVDAYCAGVPVVSLMNPAALNLSPLRGQVGVHFFSTALELVAAITEASAPAAAAPAAERFFFTDPSLGQWRRLVAADPRGVRGGSGAGVPEGSGARPN